MFIPSPTIIIIIIINIITMAENSYNLAAGYAKKCLFFFLLGTGLEYNFHPLLPSVEPCDYVLANRMWAEVNATSRSIKLLFNSMYFLFLHPLDGCSKSNGKL